MVRVPLFSKKIYSTKNQHSFVQFLRSVTDDQLSPEEAVRGYHADLKKKSGFKGTPR
jgi:hypothetical protein